MRVLVVDNYDSFAYNLVQYVGEVVTDEEWLAAPAGGRREGVAAGGRDEVVVRRNDDVSLEGIDDLDPDAVVVSPGPGTPEEAGISVPLFADREVPSLGVCLGHQALCAANGATVERAPAVVHGKASVVTHDGRGIFAGLEDPFEVGRYHSLAVEPGTLPDALEVTANTVDQDTADEDTAGHDTAGHDTAGEDTAGDDRDGEQVVMAVRHRSRPHVGVQFHPESILTSAGKRLVANFLRMAREER